jgi:hypothetical protein
MAGGAHGKGAVALVHEMGRVAADPQAQSIDAVGRPVLLGYERVLGLAVERGVDVVVLQGHRLLAAVDNGAFRERGHEVADLRALVQRAGGIGRGDRSGILAEVDIALLGLVAGAPAQEAGLGGIDHPVGRTRAEPLQRRQREGIHVLAGDDRLPGDGTLSEAYTPPCFASRPIRCPGNEDTQVTSSIIYRFAPPQRKKNPRPPAPVSLPAGPVPFRVDAARAAG